MVRTSWTEHRTMICCVRKLSFIGHTIRDGGVRAGKGHETGQVNGKLCSAIPNTSYRSPNTSYTVYTVEPLYNGHPWDWAKVTLIAG